MALQVPNAPQTQPSDPLSSQTLRTTSLYRHPGQESENLPSRATSEFMLLAKTAVSGDNRLLAFVPFEILAKIFLAFRDLILDKTFPSMGHFLTVSQVCGRWREVAHRTGALWTYIFLDFHSKRRFNRVQNMTKEWITRSGTLPLSFGVRSCYPRQHNPVIDLLLSVAFRIRELSLELPALHFPPFLSAAPGSLPILETMKLANISKSDTAYDPSCGESRGIFFRWLDQSRFTANHDSGVLWSDTPITVFDQASRLKNVSICASYSRIHPRALALTWENLTELDFSYVATTVLDAAYILPMCVALVQLKFATIASEGISMTQIGVVVMSNLQTLDWTGFDVDDRSIFCPLILPSLTSLSLVDGEEDTVILLQSRSAFVLQQLHLMSCYLTFPRLSPFLRGMPCLISLSLSHIIGISDLLDLLVYDPLRPILPRLTELYLAGGDQQGFPEISMLRMVSSRWRRTVSPTPLTQVKIQTKGHSPSPAVHRTVLYKIMDMVEGGLDFQYSC